MNQYAVFGNPIKHSLSPTIHNLFSKEMKIYQEYIAIYTPIQSLEDYLSVFFKNLGKGANITLPFKHRAYVYSDILTSQARLSGSVNTLKKMDNNLILGHNTDGLGLLYDLKRLKFINHASNILLIGAGGAAYAVIPELLSFGCSIFVFNRTLINAEKMVLKFKNLGNICCIDWLDNNIQVFDLIINATSSSMYNMKPNIPVTCISAQTFCYDMYYLIDNMTYFLLWCKKHGATRISDGLGMLVSQAAYAFKLWHNKFPEINQIIYKLKNE
ncbi:shikimate dehydrogenase [Buchnera aphidicola (Nipponaphis monzeni)]|uniref:Shikimate dehydrogenase (NADP(+)) n=1 Tax=Buchnera aphidicola (Nipponaphis monzeni) TaxID=2495405 RepID=A0A455TAM2_9GAMM|nr:shikimate dehydrogenase [Buchnera aphidicola]BBI01372.1 shikimate dehydrogenase [Buchnera aphidicola (Nipponaphis monzeni)]